MARFAFLLSTLCRLASRQARNCPFCGSKCTVLLQRKKVLLELRRCQDCFLMYRYPKDDVRANMDFYQTKYQQGMTTEMPVPEELARLLETDFRGSEKDLSANIQIVKGQIERGRVLDYGCSWGYGVYQFRQAGYDAVGFEISTPRVQYGRKHLNVEIIDSPAALGDLDSASFDVIHCSHVLEHLPDLQRAFVTFKRLLKASGILAVFVPNAGGILACQLGVKWGPMIGEKHCLALDATFFAHNLPKYGLNPVFGSSPYNGLLGPYGSMEQAQRGLTGDELLIVARPMPGGGSNF